MARDPRKPKTQVDAPETIEDVEISGVMSESYQEYAAAVVVGRAIPDVRDGLKPVHRRILHAMKVGGYDWTSGYRKSARIVGDVIGKFHPHGDSSVYEAMARLTQPWSVTAPLIDGQGNFGSPDGDGPAAMRYTEARLAKVARHLLQEIDRDTVDFRPNYDETEEEPVVLPAAFPHILVNGGSGIAVGMASSVPPHNLGEVIDATLLRLRDATCSIDQLMSALPGPDFPTGGRVLGNAGILKAYQTGRGTLDIEATTHFEKDGRSSLIVYSDMPWGVTRPSVLARINQLILDGSLPDVVSARDETDRTGARFVVELRAGADAEQIDGLLKTQTSLRTGVSLNFTLLDGRGVPRELGLAEILDEWITFRRLTIRRRASHDLRKARDRGRLLLGRMAALSVIDKIVKIIRGARSTEEAIDGICSTSFSAADFGELVDLLGTRDQRKGKRFHLERFQAEDILAMRLRRLTGLERESLEEDARAIVATMHDLREILSKPSRLDQVLAEELEAVRAVAPASRRTVIDAEASAQVIRAAAIAAPCEDTFLIQTPDGMYARSRKGPESDLVARFQSTNTHARLVFFTDRGQAYGLDVSDLPSIDDKEAPRPAPGLIGLTPQGDIIAALALSQDDLKEDGGILAFASSDGLIRRTRASEFARIPSAGKMAMKIEASDPSLIAVFRETPGLDEAGLARGGAAFLATASGKVIRFCLEDARVMSGRTSRGVRAIKLEAGDRLAAAFETPDITLSAEVTEQIEKAWLGRSSRRELPEDVRALLDGPEIVQLAASGHVKRTLLHAYRQSRRDGKGINDKGPAQTIGEIVDARLIGPGDKVILAREADEIRSIDVEEIRRVGKAATGSLCAEGASRFF